jgi:uncharacterized repeat protein (TIGR02543 family)
MEVSGSSVYLQNCNTDAGSLSGASTYPPNDSVIVVATVNPGYTFVNWTRDGCGGYDVASSNKSYTFSMPYWDVTLYANWSVNSYTLTATANAGGTATITVPAPGGSSESVPTNTSCTLVATPTPVTYKFVSWSTDSGGVSVVSTDASYTFNMPPNNYTLYANFAVLPVLTVAKTPPAGGTVTGSGSFDTGTSVTITAAPAANFVFQYWTTGLPSTAAVVSRKRNYTFNMPASNTTYTAVFVKAMFTEGFEGLAAGTARTTGSYHA